MVIKDNISGELFPGRVWSIGELWFLYTWYVLPGLIVYFRLGLFSMSHFAFCTCFKILLETRFREQWGVGSTHEGGYLKCCLFDWTKGGYFSLICWGIKF